MERGRYLYFSPRRNGDRVVEMLERVRGRERSRERVRGRERGRE